MTWLVPSVLADSSAVVHGVYGTCFTWFVTALGSALVFLVPEGLSESTEGKFLDASLGFAAGVMLAASYWSLLAPSIEMAEEDNYGEWSFVPAAVGFFLGAVFVYIADLMLPEEADSPLHFLDEGKEQDSDNKGIQQAPSRGNKPSSGKDGLRQRKGKGQQEPPISDKKEVQNQSDKSRSWRRLLLLVVAVTIHNFPEGLAVGVGFGAVGSNEKATMQAAELLTFGIGIQNFPEGLAVSLPMRRMGYSRFWCFFYGQLSGMVEPIGGFLGAAGVQLAKPMLPYALAFAAGAMVYVVVDSIIPEAQTRGNSKMASWGCMLGFLVMMTLDVALG